RPAPPPLHPAPGGDREDELLPRGVQPASGAVEAVEDDPLHGRVEAPGPPLARVARVRDLRSRLLGGTRGQLDSDQRENRGQQRDQGPERGGQAPGHETSLRRKNTAATRRSEEG